MKSIITYLSIILGVIGNYACTQRIDNVYCQNQIKLLAVDSMTYGLNIDLFDFRDYADKAFITSFKEKYCELGLMGVKFNIDSLTQIPIKLYSSNIPLCNSTGDIPPFNPFVNWINIYLTQNDTIYVRRKISTLDSIKEKVIERYLELKVKDYRKVNIALMWDEKANKEAFNNIIKQCIEGYLFIAKTQSNHLFQKQICDLNKVEIEELMYTVPFRLRTDFWAGLDLNDFVPWIRPPLPPDAPNKVENHESVN